MKLLPYERIKLQTQLTPAQIVQRFRDHVHPQIPLNLFNRKASQRSGYEGYLFRDHFTVKPIIHYRNSFLPDGRVDFRPSSTATDIIITVKLNPFATAFSILFVGFLTVLFVITLAAAVNEHRFSWYIFIPVLMVAFLYGLMMACFSAEKNGLLAFMKRLVSADLIN